MNEKNHQTAPLLLPPGGNGKLTVEAAISLVKKNKVHVETDPETGKNTLVTGDSSPPRQKIVDGPLKIPYESGSAKYAKAYYWCKALKKTYPEIKEDFESGKLKRGYKPRIQAQDKKPEPRETTQETSAETKTLVKNQPAEELVKPQKEKQPTATHQTIQIITPSFDEATKILKTLETILTTINSNISAMNNNVLELRREVTAMRSDVKRYGGGKHT